MLLGTPGPVWVGFFSTFPAWPTRRTGPFLGAPRKPAGFRSTPGRPSGSPHPQRHVRSVNHRGGLELKASKRDFLMADAALVLRTPAPSLPLSAHLPHRVLGPGHHLRGSQGQCLEAWSGRLGVDLPPPTSPPGPGTQEPVPATLLPHPAPTRARHTGACRRAGPGPGCPGPHLLCGLPDAVTHSFHVALLFLQLLLELCDPGLQAALLILQRVPKGKAAALGPPASPGLGSSLPWRSNASGSSSFTVKTQRGLEACANSHSWEAGSQA